MYVEVCVYMVYGGWREAHLQGKGEVLGVGAIAAGNQGHITLVPLQ